MEEVEAYQARPVVHLDENIIKKYICPVATEQEIYMFLQLCKGQQLNPFLREAYLIKYGNTPATIVTGKDTFIKRARSISAYKGFRAGIVVLNPKNELTYREGGIVLKGESLIGGWAEVFRNDCEAPVRSEVDFDEYVAKKSDGTINKQWTEKPATMIRKVALVQAHREAFPDQFEGMYSPEEMGVEVDNIEYKDDKPAEGYKQQPQSKSGQAETQTENRTDEQKIADKKERIQTMLDDLFTDEVIQADFIKTMTSFEGKDGKQFTGYDSLDKIKYKADSAVKSWSILESKIKEYYTAQKGDNA